MVCCVLSAAFVKSFVKPFAFSLPSLQVVTNQAGRARCKILLQNNNQAQHCSMDVVKFQQTLSEEGYMAVNLPGHVMGMVPRNSVATQGPQHMDPKAKW